MSLYQDCLDLGINVANHESDLYIPCNSVTVDLIEKYNHTGVKTFFNRLTNTLWYDVPFMFDPFWENKARSKVSI